MAHGGAAVAAASREELERRMEELRVHEEFDAIVADGRPGTAEKWENVGQIHPRLSGVYTFANYSKVPSACAPFSAVCIAWNEVLRRAITQDHTTRTLHEITFRSLTLLHLFTSFVMN